MLQAGYELFGRIVRPAMVVVAAKDSTGAPLEGPGPISKDDRSDDLADAQA